MLGYLPRSNRQASHRIFHHEFNLDIAVCIGIMLDVPANYSMFMLPYPVDYAEVKRN